MNTYVTRTSRHLRVPVSVTGGLCNWALERKTKSPPTKTPITKFRQKKKTDSLFSIFFSVRKYGVVKMRDFCLNLVIGGFCRWDTSSAVFFLAGFLSVGFLSWICCYTRPKIGSIKQLCDPISHCCRLGQCSAHGVIPGRF